MTATNDQLPTWVETLLRPGPARAIAAFCVLVAFYSIAHVTNRYEALDTLSFSADAEALPFWSNRDSRMMLFYHVYRSVFRSVTGLGFNADVYTVLCLLGAMFAAGSVLLLYRMLKRAFGLSETASVAGALTLASSYGFLRYANEIEVYIGSTFLILLCLNLLFHEFGKGQLKTGRAILLGITCGLAVTYYQPIAFPLFFGATVLFVYNRWFSQYLAYGIAGTATFSLIAILALWTEHGYIPSIREFVDFILARSEEFNPVTFGIVPLLKAAQAIVHDLASLTWLYAMPGMEDRIKQFQPQHYYYAEEIFFAARNYPLVWLAAATFLATLAWLAYLILQSVHSGNQRPFDVKVAFVFAWFAFAAAANLVLNPGEREVWIISLPVIAILLSVFVYEPLRHQRWKLAVIVALLLCHNLIGGIGIYANAKGDLYAGRTNWIRQHGNRDDWVLTTGEQTPWFNKMRILRYPIAHKPSPGVKDEFFKFMYFDGDIATIQHWRDGPPEQVSPNAMLQALKNEGNRLFVLDAVLSPRPLPPRLDQDGRYHKLAAFGDFLRAYATVVDDGPYGKTYEIDKAKLPPTFAGN